MFFMDVFPNLASDPEGKLTQKGVFGTLVANSALKYTGNLTFQVHIFFFF